MVRQRRRGVGRHVGAGGWLTSPSAGRALKQENETKPTKAVPQTLREREIPLPLMKECQARGQERKEKKREIKDKKNENER